MQKNANLISNQSLYSPKKLLSQQANSVYRIVLNSLEYRTAVMQNTQIDKASYLKSPKSLEQYCNLKKGFLFDPFANLQYIYDTVDDCKEKRCHLKQRVKSLKNF